MAGAVIAMGFLLLLIYFISGEFGAAVVTIAAMCAALAIGMRQLGLPITDRHLFMVALGVMTVIVVVLIASNQPWPAVFVFAFTLALHSGASLGMNDAYPLVRALSVTTLLVGWVVVMTDGDGRRWTQEE